MNNYMNTKLSTTMILSLVFNENSSESSVECFYSLINLVQINFHNELNVINILVFNEFVLVFFMNTLSATI